MAYDKFADYMYYLLTTPFKRVRKAANNWYLLFKVLGAWMDDCMEDIYKAREEGMVATCSDIMLSVHASDRDMYRLPGESNDNYRCRIAWYTELKRLGGTEQGVLLAIKTLGYEDPKVVRATEHTGDAGRWAEFYIILENDIDYTEPVAFEVLKSQVRRVKYSAAKDNYLFRFFIEIQATTELLRLKYRALIVFVYYDYLQLDGSWKLEGNQLLESTIRQFPILSRQMMRIIGNEERISKIRYVKENNYWTLDGTYQLNGKLLDAYRYEEEL